MHDLNAEIHSIICELLTLAEFDDTVPFIELGGQSVIMGMLQNTLKHKYGVTVPFEEMFRDGSVNGLAAYITGHKDNVIHGYQDVQFSPAPEKRFAPFPLTGIQTAYYVGRTANTELGGNPTRGYSEILCQPYDHTRLQSAINCLAAEHDIFRLQIRDDQTQQVLDTEITLPLPEEDISALSEAEQTAFLAQKRERIFNTPFDLCTPPLIRFEATYLGDQRAILHFSHDGMIIDGWSHDKLIHDLDCLYADETAKLKAPEILFRDYVCYLEQVRQTQKYQDDRAYWLGRNMEQYEKPALPLKCDPSEVKEVTTHQVLRYISKETWNGVREFAAAKGITPFALLMTAFGKAVLKYSSNQKFLLNIPASIRPDICGNIDDLLGECSNFFICSQENRMGESILDAAYANQRQIAEVMQHSAFLGTDLIRELQKTHGANIAAPVVFTSIIDTPDRENRFLEKVYTKTHTSQVWIDAIAMRNGDGIMLVMDCTEQLFDAAVMDGIGDTFAAILELYAAQDLMLEQSGTAPLLANERTCISPCIDNPIRPVSETVSEMLFAAYQMHINDPAVITEQGTKTYAVVYQEASIIAEAAQKAANAQCRFAIGLYLEKGALQPTAALAASMINCPFLPIDIEYGDETLRYIIKKAELRVLLTDHLFYDRLSAIADCAVINIEQLSGSDDRTVTFYPAEPDDTVFLINTSGTTGRPKTVIVKQEGLANCLQFTKNRIHLTSSDRFFSITNYCHDMAMYDIFGAFTAGAAMVIPTNTAQKEPRHWVDLIKAFGVTIWNSVPSFHEMLMASELSGLQTALASVRCIISGGEFLRLPLVKKMKRNFVNAAIYNVGGPAETTIWSIGHLVTDADIRKGQIPYGKPIDNMRYYIFNDMMTLCPPGAVGTMYAAGAGVTAGYLELPDETAEKYILHDGIRMYNTGDCGCYLPDGSILFTGRKDSQVKINGKRIELNGIAQLLCEQAGIFSAAVIRWENQLVGFYTAADTISKTALCTALGANLPDYMIPLEFIHLSQIPLTHNGKTDTFALEQIYRERKNQEKTEQTQNLTEYEQTVLRLCSEVMKQAVTDPDANFFELGGNSITAIQLIAAIEKQYQITLSIYDILNTPTVRAWCSILYDKLQA